MAKTTKFWGGPGTGKTARLIQEINRLLDEGYGKSSFVVTTFRRRMADELISRLGWDLKKGGIINTIHGVCRSLAGIDSVMDEKDRAAFCKEIGLLYKPEGGGDLDYEPTISGSKKLGNLFFDARSFLVNIKSFLANDMLDFSKIYSFSDIEKLRQQTLDPPSFMEHVSEKYEVWKAEKGYSDFDDMLKIVYEKRLIPDARVLVVDEFQDLTPLQYAIICMWAAGMEIVLIAGDPRQTIYGFWGASSKFFEEHEGEQVVLPYSYRLPRVAWDFAVKILEGAGLSAPDIEADKNGTLKKIPKEVYQDLLPRFGKDVYHLVRINEMGKEIAFSLARAGIPFRGILGWSNRQIDLYNAIIKLRRCLLREEHIHFSKGEVDMLLEVFPKKYFACKKAEIKEPLDKNSTLFFSDLLKWFGGRRTLERVAAGLPEDSLGVYRKVDSLAYIKIQKTLRNNNQELITSPSVVLSTIHGVKGGEADVVFLYDSITKKIYKKLYEDRQQEARRSEAQVFFVGATRVRQALYVVESGDRYTYRLPGGWDRWIGKSNGSPRRPRKPGQRSAKNREPQGQEAPAFSGTRRTDAQCICGTTL